MPRGDAECLGTSPAECGTASLDQVLSKIGLGYFHYRLLFVCGIGFSAAAVEVVLTAFLFPELRTHWDLNEYELGMLPTIVSVGCCLGELFWGHVADRSGRRWVFMVTVWIVVSFGVVSSFAKGIWSLSAIRFMVGFGYGGNIAVDFALFSEFLPTHGRGWMLFGMSAFWPIGQLLTVFLAWAVIPRYGWRTFLVVCAVPSMITALLRPLIPESPRWLLLHGKEEEALEVCQAMAKLNNLAPEDVGLSDGTRLSLANETESISAQTSQDVVELPLRKLFGKGLWRTTVGSVTFVAALGFAGYATTTFMPSFLEMKGMKQLNIYESMMLSTLSQFPGIVLAAFLGTRVGRLGPIYTSLLLCGVALAFFALANGHMEMVVCACLASCCLEFGWALQHVYTPEVFPTELRAASAGIISASGSVVSGGTPLITAWLVETQSTAHVIAFFSTVCAISSVALYTLLHVETMSRDLQDVSRVK